MGHRSTGWIAYPKDYPKVSTIIGFYKSNVHRAQEKNRYKRRQTSLERMHTEMVRKDDNAVKEEVNQKS